MKITVNLEGAEFLERELSISEIMRRMKYTFPHIITRLNGHLVDREQRDLSLVSDGDDLEIYHLISGG
ncbi:MAG TPA: sulfur carrier protein ThiS [Rectinemataceae bacterium]|nr:sulfur carrier protein ThiS [Rectinemataceae bacterium]